MRTYLITEALQTLQCQTGTLSISGVYSNTAQWQGMVDYSDCVRGLVCLSLNKHIQGAKYIILIAINWRHVLTITMPVAYTVEFMIRRVQIPWMSKKTFSRNPISWTADNQFNHTFLTTYILKGFNFENLKINRKLANIDTNTLSAFFKFPQVNVANISQIQLTTRWVPSCLLFTNCLQTITFINAISPSLTSVPIQLKMEHQICACCHGAIKVGVLIKLCEFVILSNFEQSFK